MSGKLILLAILCVIFFAAIAAADDTMLFTPGGNWELPDECMCACWRFRLKARIQEMAGSVLDVVSKTLLTERA